MPVTIKSAREIELMAEAGRILEIVHNELRDALHAGMSTLDIDRFYCKGNGIVIYHQKREISEGAD